MNPRAHSPFVRLFVVVGVGVWSACSSQAAGQSSSGATGGQSSSGFQGGQTASSSSGSGPASNGAPTSSGGSTPIGAGSSSGDSLASADSDSGTGNGGSSGGSGAVGGSAGSPSGSASGGAPDAGLVSSVAAGDAGVVVPLGCAIPATVSFTQDVQPFLAASCGKVNGGCHVLDASSTAAEGGKDHAYDWITGPAHPSSCPEMPTPYRWQIVMAVMAQADPPSCSKCGIMPPAGIKPFTTCQIATLQAWIDEPFVVQTPRSDGTTPPAAYAMPPFN